jgi:hypothetical protein
MKILKLTLMPLLLFAVFAQAQSSPQITTTSLPDGTAGYLYRKYIEATEFIYECDIVDGELPPNLHIDSDGEIWGSISDEAEIKAYTFTVEAKFRNGRTATKQLSITVEEPHMPIITTTSLPNGVVGENYHEVLEATGGVDYWEIEDEDDLPPGLYLGWSGGIYGRPEPAAAGNTYTFTVWAENDLGISESKQFSITIEPPPSPVIERYRLDVGYVGAFYREYLYAENYVETWSKVSGELPPGLELDEDGYISGRILATAETKTYKFKVEARNTSGLDTATFTIEVTKPAAPVININPLPIGTVDSYYSEYLEIDTYAEWSIVSGDLPSGLELENYYGYGLISGRPEEAGTYTFTLKATNVSGSDEKTFTIVIEEPHIPMITTASLPNAKVGTRYREYLRATGGDIVWEFVTELPDGLSLDYDGEIYGYPVAAGTYTFTVRATNEIGSIEKNYTITIDPPIKPVIPGTTLPNGVVGEEYEQVLAAISTGSTIEAAIWSIESGSLPPGLELENELGYGVIYGIPEVAGTYTFTLKASNAAGFDSKQVSIKINEVLGVPVIITSTLPAGTAGETYLQRIEATEYAEWDVIDGNLPPGLQLRNGGYLTGVPTAAAAGKTYTFKVIATNAAGSSAVVQFSIAIGASSPILLPQIANLGNILLNTDANAITLSNLPSNTKIDVYNLQGKHIYSSNSANSQILRIQVQTKGMYIVKAGNQAMRATVK